MHTRQHAHVKLLLCTLPVPQETLAFLANPSSISGDALPPGLEGFDPQAFLTAAVSVGALSLIPQVRDLWGHDSTVQQ